MMVYPRFIITPEKNQLVYMGKLITSDLDTVREEAFAGKEELIVEFNNQGYNFRLGTSEISRSFQEYQFNFELPKAEESGDSNNTGSDFIGKSYP